MNRRRPSTPLARNEWRAWRPDWDKQKAGDSCPLCDLCGVQENDWGIRVLTGLYIDGYLWKRGTVPGYCVALWKRGHVAEPTALSDDEAAGYWLEVVRLGRAVEQTYEPSKMNYETLGNNVPHLHTHVIPRPALDPAPNGPLPWEFLDTGVQDADILRWGVAALSDAFGLRSADRPD